MLYSGADPEAAAVLAEIKSSKFIPVKGRSVGIAAINFVLDTLARMTLIYVCNMRRRDLQLLFFNR